MNGLQTFSFHATQDEGVAALVAEPCPRRDSNRVVDPCRMGTQHRETAAMRPLGSSIGRCGSRGAFMLSKSSSFAVACALVGLWPASAVAHHQYTLSGNARFQIRNALPIPIGGTPPPTGKVLAIPGAPRSTPTTSLPGFSWLAGRRTTSFRPTSSAIA